VLAVETDYPEDFVEFFLRLRETDAGPFTARDTPSFTCVQAPVEEMLERIG
jgi:chlorite dismutase